MRKIQDSRFKIQDYKYWVLFSVLCVLLFAGYVQSQGLVVMAKKVSGELPSDPKDGAWGKAVAINVPLVPQVMAKPRIYESKIKELKVRAMHNTKDIAFLIEWEDPTDDSSVDIDKFSDAVALEFPSQTAKEKPHFAMGDKENTVNIWFWKATWQKAVEGERLYAMVDDFAGGIEVGNPVSKQRAIPVENIIAQGFGSATDMEKANNQNVTGKGLRDGNRWIVLFKRPLSSSERFEALFKEGGVTPVAFAVWNGSDGERGGRKVVSTWYYVGLETEEKKTTYIYPIIAFIVTAAILAGIIFLVRKKRG
ncbi:MAG: ethylbenzene dehydrogenase-related protein [Thermodesulfovibrionales bacterium]